MQASRQGEHLHKGNSSFRQTITHVAESAKAKSEGRYKERKPIAAARRHSVLKLASEGATRVAIAAQSSNGVITLYKILALNTAQHL